MVEKTTAESLDDLREQIIKLFKLNEVIEFINKLLC